jgi:hypothetical protein
VRRTSAVLLLLLRGWAWGMRGGRDGGGVGWVVEGGLAAMSNGAQVLGNVRAQARPPGRREVVRCTAASRYSPQCNVSNKQQHIMP